MRKNFVMVLPDEPYKVTTNKNIQVPCIYTGMRYLLVRMNNDDTVFCLERQAETLEEIERFKIPAEHLKAEGHWQIVLDADVHTMEAAYLTHEYEHGEVEDYREVLPTGEVFEYYYADHCGVVEQVLYTNDLRYDRSTKTWIRPRYRSHALTRNQFLESMASQAATYKEALSAGTYLPDHLALIQKHYDFVSSVPTKYAKVDHWKIPFPSDTPSL